MVNGITNVRDSGSKRAAVLSFATTFKEINGVMIHFELSAFSNKGKRHNLQTLSVVILNCTM